MTNQQKLSKLRRICRRLGITLVNKKSPLRDYVWTGRMLYAVRSDEGTYTMDSQDICHEIAHWQVAAPSRRRYKHFNVPNLMSEMIEEELATIVGAGWEIALGSDIRTVITHSGLCSFTSPLTHPTRSSYRGSIWHQPEELREWFAFNKQMEQLGAFLWLAMKAQNLGYLKNGRPTYYTNPGRRAWTKTNRRSSGRSHTSSQTRAGTAATRSSSQSKTSARAA